MTFFPNKKPPIVKVIKKKNNNNNANKNYTMNHLASRKKITTIINKIQGFEWTHNFL